MNEISENYVYICVHRYVSVRGGVVNEEQSQLLTEHSQIHHVETYIEDEREAEKEHGVTHGTFGST